MKNFKVGKIGLLDMLKFANLQKNRNKHINKTQAKEIVADFPINNFAKEMHPDFQEFEILEIIEHKDANAKSFVFKRTDGKDPAYFRAGQYLSIKLQIGDSFVTRPYSISSSPKETLEGKVRITVKAQANGFVSDFILNEWKVGDTVIASGGEGTFYYEDLRDAKDVIALAGGSGITPFVSMAHAIEEGEEDFNLTLLYGCNTEKEILFKDELDAIANKCNKVNVVYVLANEDKDNYIHGYLDAALIKKFIPENKLYSLFVCGPTAMYNFVKKEIVTLNLERKFVRYELLGASKTIYDYDEFPKEAKNKEYEVTIKQGPNEYKINAKSNEPVLVAIERAGVKAPSKCRSGECGWCRSRMISGDVFIQPGIDGRRWADIQANYIHPCISFPTSDITIEVPYEFF